MIHPMRQNTKSAGTHSLTVRRSEEHTSELQSPYDLVCRLLLEKNHANRANQAPHSVRHGEAARALVAALLVLRHVARLARHAGREDGCDVFFNRTEAREEPLFSLAGVPPR